MRKGFNDACRDFSFAIADRGFSRTKTRLWVRLAEDAIDVLSLYREGSSYGAPIGGNVDIRIQSYFRRPFDKTPHLVLNGPQSDVAQTRSGRYHLRFNAKSRHMYDRCMTDLIRFVDGECEPWFAQMKASAPFVAQVADDDPRASNESRKLLGLDRLLDDWQKAQNNGVAGERATTPPVKQYPTRPPRQRYRYDDNERTS